MEVVVELREEQEFILDCCQKHNVNMKVDYVGHSQGAAVNNGILLSGQFKEGGKYHDVIGSIATFGGASFAPNGENYVQEGDVVPYLNPDNWGKFGSDNVHIIQRNEDSIFEAHDFDGHGYQNALRDFIDHIMVVTK